MLLCTGLYAEREMLRSRKRLDATLLGGGARRIVLSSVSISTMVLYHI